MTGGSGLNNRVDPPLRLSNVSVSRMKQPVDTVNYVLVLYKLAPVGLLYASLHSCNKACVTGEHPNNGVLDQLLRIFAVGGSHMLELRFNVGREMDVHRLQVT